MTDEQAQGLEQRSPVRLSRRDLMHGAGAAALLALGVEGDSRLSADAKLGLRDHAASRGLLYGAAVEARTIRDDPAYAACVGRECGLLVPENDLKWERLRPAPDAFDFTRADALARFAARHGMLQRGHTLVWQHQLPAWFFETVDASNAERTLVDHITTVVGRYAGRMHSWDVVNEVISLDDGRADGLRDTPWLRRLGPEHIPLAFEAAAEADPNALLVYNENAIEYDRPHHAAKRAAVLRLLDRLVARRTPIHALGIQAHLDGDLGTLRQATLERFLDDVASLGLQVLITELDVLDWELPASIPRRDAHVAATYQRFLEVALAHRAVLGIVTWGLSDRYSWLRTYASRSDGAPVRPLPLDSMLRPKRAYDAIVEAFRQAPRRRS